MNDLSWPIVDEIASELGAKDHARAKWRQRGVPAEWRIRVAQELLSRGVPFSLDAFDSLPKTPGRIAA